MSGSVPTWVKAPRWSVSHLVVGDLTLGLNANLWADTACGRHVNYDLTEPEPTGIDTCNRCPACRRLAVDLGADGDE